MINELVFKIGDIKQYFYCPRIVYFNYLMPRFRPVTYKMEEGKLRQSEQEKLEKRRTVARFDLFDDERRSHVVKQFNVRLYSDELGLSGMLDMLLIVEDEAIPVDFKDGSFARGEVVALHHKYQLIGYGLLVEACLRKKAMRGFIHSIEEGKAKSVNFSEGAKMFLRGKIRKMHEMIINEILPHPTPHYVRCRECEFRPVCRG